METAVVDDVVVHETSPDEQAEIAAAKAKAGSVEMIPVQLIERSQIALRGVQRQKEEYIQLVESVRRKGVLNSILVRRVPGPGGSTVYGLIDGLQRYSAACDAELEMIPARIVEMDDAEMLEAQIITNLNRVITKPADVSKHLMRMMARNPMLTVRELAEKCCQSTSWVEQRLSLTNLTEPIQALVNEAKINLINAYALSKIPEEEQAQHVDAAMSEPSKTFVPRMKQRVKEIRDAKRAGRDAGDAEFKPQKHVQKVALLKDELEVLSGEKEGDSNIIRVLQEAGLSVDDNAKQIAQLAIAWVLNFDAASQKAQEAKAEQREKARKLKSEQLKKEREARKAREEAAKAADFTTM